MGSEVQSAAGGYAAAPWLVRSTSPLHCALAFVAAMVLQQWLALPMPGGGVRDGMHVAGTVLANGGLLLVLWSFALFVHRHTTIMPGGTPSRLVLSGPFRWTRNPAYIGMLASYAGLALMLDVPWALALLPVPLWILRCRIIPWEEAMLDVRFGAEYAAYREAVPRWL